MKILEIVKREKNGDVAVTSYHPASFVLKEGINLSTGEVLRLHSVDTGEGWFAEVWGVERPATEEEKAAILADLPRFNDEQQKLKIANAAFRLANWGEDISRVLKAYDLPESAADLVIAEAGKMWIE